jgi:hypothetical protein
VDVIGFIEIFNAHDAEFRYVSRAINDLPKTINRRPMQQCRLRLLKIINLADKWNNSITYLPVINWGIETRGVNGYIWYGSSER